MRPTALSPRPIVEPMEARILHSADLAPLALAAVATETLVQQPVRSEAAVQRSEIVFVDASLPDAAELVADLQAQRGAGRSIEIVTFAAGADGLALIGETLATRHDIAAVHVLAHGSDGRLQLGSAVLDAQTLLRRAGELAAWGDALTADADLLLYGCDLAQDAGEQQLVRDLAALTGADVAASTDLTGAASRGGNWTLEYATGRIEAALAPSVQEQAQWQGVLATYAVTNTGDVVGATLLPGTLRWAISQANANAGADRIVFAVNGTFNSASLGIGDDRNVSGDFDITDSVDIVGNGSANTVINGNGADRVFDIRNGTVTLSGLTVQGGRSDAGGGVRINPAGRATLTDVVVQNNVGNGATLGAGIYNNGILTLNRVLVRNNGDLLSGAAAGAGVYNDIATTLDARDVEIRDNVSTGLSGGGGMTLARNTTATLQNVTIAGNRGESGGGLKNQSSRASLVDVTLSGNRAVSDGGGLWSDRAITLDHVTIAGNTAVSGGGVFDAGTTVTARNSLFSGNAGGNTNKALISQGYNLSDDGSAGFTGAGDRSNTPAGLLALADNGGFTRTRALGAGSAAVDAADPLPASGTDQRGMAVYGGRADIGAYEYTPYGFAPTIGAIADQTVAEDGTLGPLAFTVGDIESGGAGVVVIATSSNTALVPNAAIVLGGSGSSRTVSLTPAANANSAVNGGPATITLSVSDGSNVTRTAFTITVQAVNDAPALTLPAAQPVAEDGALVFSGANGNALAAADADAGSAPLQLTLAVANGTLTLGQTSGLAFVTGSGSDNASMTFSGSQSAINAALAGLRYRPRADYSGSDRLDLNINDLGGSGSGGARSAAGSVAIAVNAVNDAPVLGLPGAQSTPQPAPLSFSAAAGNAITVADIDAGAAPLQLSLSTANLQANGTLSFGRLTGLTLLVGTGTNDTVVLLRGSAADLNAALDTLTFQATAPGAARIDIALDDLGNSGSGGAAQAGGAVAISVGNDSPPVLTLGHATRTYTEGDGPIKLDPSLGLADSDNATLASARVRIGPGYAGTEGVLAFANNRATMGNIAGSYGAGVLTLTSAGQTATVAEWEQALASVTYVDASTAPSTAPRTVTLTVNDGIADSAARQIVVSVVPANDAPLLTGANDFRPIAEDTTENHGTLVSTLIAGHLTDADSPALAGIAVVGVDDAMGRWQYTTDGGIHWNAFGTVGDGAARLLAADADSAVRFVPAPDWNGTVADGLRFRAWDLTTSSAGDAADSSVNGDRTAFSAGTAASSVTVTPVNDAPVLAGAIAKQSATQDQPYAFTLAAGTFTDIDAGDTVSYVATLASGAALPPWLSFDAATQRFSGTPANADVGPTTLRVTATDASGASAFCDFALAVADVDDAPVLAAAVADQSVLAGTALRFDIPPATFADPDAGDTLRYAATLADGTALPRWLNFDATAPGFAATPSAADAGRVAVRLTATDRAGASAQALFTITVSAPDAPAPVPAMPPPVVGVPAAADVPVVESPAPTVPVVDATALPPAGTVPPAAAVPVVATPAPLPAANPSPAPTVPVADAVAPLPVVKALPLLATPVVDAAAPLPTFKAAPAETIASADLPSLSKPATAAYTATAVPVELSLLAGPAPVPVSDALPSPVAAFGPAEAPHRTAMVVIDPVATPIHAAIRSDALLPTMTAPQFADTMIAPLMQLLRSDELMRKLQETERYALVQHEARRTAMASSVVVTGGLSIGYVVWLVRGGVLMSSMLSALPAWQMVDPLPVLAAARPSRKAARDDDDRDAADDREVERLFDERAARGQRDAVPPACAGAPGLPAVSGEPRR